METVTKEKVKKGMFCSNFNLKEGHKNLWRLQGQCGSITQVYKDGSFSVKNTSSNPTVPGGSRFVSKSIRIAREYLIK